MSNNKLKQDTIYKLLNELEYKKYLQFLTVKNMRLNI